MAREKKEKVDWGRRAALKLIAGGALATFFGKLLPSRAWELGPLPEKPQEPPIIPAGGLVHFLDPKNAEKVENSLKKFEEIAGNHNPVAAYAAIVAHYYGLLNEDYSVLSKTIERLLPAHPHHAIALALFDTLRYTGALPDGLLKKVSSANPYEILEAEHVIHDSFGVRANLLSIWASKRLFANGIKESTEGHTEVRIPVLTREYIERTADVIIEALKPRDDMRKAARGAVLMFIPVLLYSRYRGEFEKLKKDLRKYVSEYVEYLKGNRLKPYLSWEARKRLKKGLAGSLAFFLIFLKGVIDIERAEKSRPPEIKRLLHPNDLYAVDKNPHLRRYTTFTRDEKKLMERLPEPPLVKVKIR